jgi:hypothetical protein
MLALHFAKMLKFLRLTHHLNDHCLSAHRINMGAYNFQDIGFGVKTRLDNNLGP